MAGDKLGRLVMITLNNNTCLLNTSYTGKRPVKFDLLTFLVSIKNY